jgi:hypothetical protein
MMEDQPTGVELLIDRVKEYAETRISLIKLIAIDKASGFASNIVSMIILLMIFFTFIFCISISLALWIGSMLDSYIYGFLLVAAFYLVIGFIVFSLRNKLLKTPVSNKLISQLIDQ